MAKISAPEDCLYDVKVADHGRKIEVSATDPADPQKRVERAQALNSASRPFTEDEASAVTKGLQATTHEALKKRIES